MGPKYIKYSIGISPRVCLVLFNILFLCVNAFVLYFKFIFHITQIGVCILMGSKNTKYSGYYSNGVFSIIIHLF